MLSAASADVVPAEETAVTVENQPAPVIDVTADLATFWELRAAQLYARGEEVLREINEYRLQAMIEAVNASTASTEDDEMPMFLRKAVG